MILTDENYMYYCNSFDNLVSHVLTIHAAERIILNANIERNVPFDVEDLGFSNYYSTHGKHYMNILNSRMIVLQNERKSFFIHYYRLNSSNDTNIYFLNYSKKILILQ